MAKAEAEQGALEKAEDKVEVILKLEVEVDKNPKGG